MTMFPALFARMSRLRQRLGGAPAISPAELQDAPLLAALHGDAFRRGWSTEEFERLLVEHNVVADRAMSGSRLVGFVVSRIAADEAEILSIAVTPEFRGAGLARRMLEVHLRRLVGYGVARVFLEVDEHNTPARRLYSGFGFAKVARRESYYASAAAALVLRRNLS